MVSAVLRSKPGPINGLKHFSGLLNGDQSKAFIVERAEIWIGNNGNKSVTFSSTEKPKGLVQKILSQVQMPLTSVIDTQNHPWLSGQTP